VPQGHYQVNGYRKDDDEPADMTAKKSFWLAARPDGARLRARNAPKE
jgi:hypothetical protein